MPLPETAAILRAAATWLRASSSSLTAIPEPMRAYAKSILGDALELLDLSGTVLATSPLPARLSEWPAAFSQQLSMVEVLRAVPHAGTGALLLSYVFAGLLGIGTALFLGPRWHSAPRTYWLTRLVLLRGMGLVYLAAFATSAAQSRALFGSLGLSPDINRPSGRPSPAFDGFGFGRTDLALEVASWLGVLLSLLLLLGVVQWAALLAALWVLYLSIVNLGARVVIGYGWEWATCEVGFLMIFLLQPLSRSFSLLLTPSHSFSLLLTPSRSFSLLLAPSRSFSGGLPHDLPVHRVAD